MFKTTALQHYITAIIHCRNVAFVAWCHLNHLVEFKTAAKRKIALRDNTQQEKKEFKHIEKRRTESVY